MTDYYLQYLMGRFNWSDPVGQHVEWQSLHDDTRHCITIRTRNMQIQGTVYNLEILRNHL